MTALRRTTTIRGFPMKALDLKTTCDVCGRPRSFGLNTYKHTKCSKIRQERNRGKNG
jgi:hypothetical protein